MGKNLSKVTHTFLFCDGSSCRKAHSEQITREARAYLRNNGLWDTTHTVKTRCNGRCEDAPTCIVSPGEFWYKELTPQKIIPIVKSHIDHQQPIASDLLYKKGWEEMASNNERPAVKPKAFQLKEDSELGNCFIARGFSSDQYLYPLFLYLKEHPEGVYIHEIGGEGFSFKEIRVVNYTSSHTLELQTETTAILLTIGAVPKDNNTLQKSKISVTEYFYINSTKQAGIRFKNKFGKTLAIIEFDSIENKSWHYCKEIQLQNIATKQLV